MSTPLPTSLKKSLVSVAFLEDVVDFSDIVTDPKTLTVISKSAYRKVKISWPEQMGALYYNVYGSFSPAHKTHRINDEPIKDASLTFSLPVVPQTMEFYAWASRVNAIGTETYLDQDPATEQSSTVLGNWEKNPLTPILGIPVTGPLNKHMREVIIPQMRQRAQFELENDGEEAEIFVRRFAGTPCPCNRPDPNSKPSDPVGEGQILLSNSLGARLADTGQRTDSDYQGNGRCLVCFGTGIVGGYFPSFTIRIRYGNMPVQNMVRNKFGYTVTHSFGSWTLWSPRLSKFDVLVRKKDGTRFTVDTNSQSEDRGLVLHQDFQTVAIPISDIRAQIQNDLILKATHEHEFLKEGLRAFA